MCTSIVAGKRATADGTILIARNEDFPVNNWPKCLRYRLESQYDIIRKNNPDETEWTLGNGVKIPMPERKGYAYCSIPDALGETEASSDIDDLFFFEERGVNEKGVAISATNSMEINEKARLAGSKTAVDAGIDECIIATLLLPQADSAIDAVEKLGRYVEEYGASEGNGVLIADKEEIWYFEIGSGRHWIAVKVDADKYMIIPNCMCINNADLDNSSGVRHSQGLFEFVQEHGLLENPSRESFDFAKAFGCLYTTVEDDNGKVKDKYYNIDRIWLGHHILSPAKDFPFRQEHFPMFMKPDRKITIEDVTRVLRATYHGTVLEHEDEKPTRPIGVVRTAESHIISIEPEESPLRTVIWQALGSPLGAPYLPFFAINDHIPDSYTRANDHYEPSSAYWVFRSLFALSALRGDSYVDDLAQFWIQFEKQMHKGTDMVKQDMKSAQDDAKALELARQFSERTLRLAVSAANEKFEKWITEIIQEQSDKKLI